MKKLFSPIPILFVGILLGILAKLFDLYTEILGDIFSQLPIWILFCVILSVYSKNALYAMINVFVFNQGMLNAYYICAAFTNAVYGLQYIQFWQVIAIFSPIFAYITWFSKEPKMYAKWISLIIVGSSLCVSIFLYGIRLDILVINLILICFVLLVDVDRSEMRVI